MASVFRALDPRLERNVAIKVFASSTHTDKSLDERFWREARAVATLTHPNIITIYDFGDDKGFTYIVMEYLTGGTLTDRMDRKFEIEGALRYISPLGQALDYAHKQGIVHRDVKPANVLLDDDDSPILSDFGIARMLHGSAQLTAPQTVLGTAEYMSPEQVLGRPADHRSDNYSFGIIVYQMLLGQTPFHGDTPATTQLAHIHQPVPRLQEVDPNIEPRLEPILLKALAKTPDDRYQTPTELVEALSSISSQSKGRVDIDLRGRTVIVPPDEDEIGPVSPDAISSDQARLVAIQHARENTEFTGPSTPGRAWPIAPPAASRVARVSSSSRSVRAGR